MADPYSGLDPNFANNLRAMFAAAPGALSIVSGYRSPEHQATLWNAALEKYGSPEAARKWVAPPGMSMHNQHLAADLGYGGPALGSGSNDLITWAHQHAGDYGLTFPLSNENWHIEPIGARQGSQPQQGSQPAGMDTPSPQAATDAASPGNLPPKPPSLDWMSQLDPSMRQPQQAQMPFDPLQRWMSGQNPFGDNPLDMRASIFKGLSALFS